MWQMQETYSEPYQTSSMFVFCEKTIFEECSILDTWLGAEYTCECYVIVLQIKGNMWVKAFKNGPSKIF